MSVDRVVIFGGVYRSPVRKYCLLTITMFIIMHRMLILSVCLFLTESNNYCLIYQERTKGKIEVDLQDEHTDSSRSKVLLPTYLTYLSPVCTGIKARK